jgi:superfamily II DNA or RNA helicase
VIEAESDDELTLRVKTAGRPVAPTVTLYPIDEEWSCDCGSRQDPCEHVAAAVIAARQARQGGPSLARERPPQLRLGYRFDIERTWLRLRRVTVDEAGRELPFEGSLTRSVEVPAGLTPTHDDLKVDRIVTSLLRGDHIEPYMGTIAPALEGADVRFAGRAVRVRGEALAPEARIYDRGEEVVVEVRPAEELTEVVARGVALCGDELRALAETELTGVRLEHLPHERTFTMHQLGELVSNLLPEFEKRFSLRVESARLPREGGKQRPRIAFELGQDVTRLTVLPTLVYGDPPVARVDAGRLVHLGGPVPQRDESEERRLLGRLRDELHLVPGRRVTLTGVEATRLAERIRAWSRQRQDPASARWFGEVPLVPKLSIDGDRFDLSFDVADVASSGEAETRAVSPEAVVSAWREGLSLVPLDGGGWAPLPVDWLSRFGHHVADLLAARDADGEVATSALPALAELCAELGEPPPPRLERLRPLLEEFSGIPRAELPDDLTASLRPYQQAGVDWLRFLRRAGLGGVLADDMGLGKTLQALCVVDGRTLVVCPRSVVHNWADEIRKFRPGLSVNVFHGPGRSLTDARVTLTTYALLRMDIDTLEAERWDMVVLDEAQSIKNPDSQAARAAYRLRAEFRLSLSGTPVENRLDELWSQLHFTNPGLLGARRDFDTRYASPIGTGDAAAAERLRQKVRPFVLRRLKRDVLPDLPPRTDTVLQVELDERERDIYEAVRAATREDVVRQLRGGGSVLAALEALLRLRQAACHPQLLPGHQAERSSKLERLLLALEDAAADGHKALVFSQWTSLLDLVEPHLAGIPYVRLDGSTRDRAAVVDRFQDPDGPPVMLVSLKAGGTGLNLTAADHVFLLDPWWNPAVEDQAADRAHRIGQERPVMVYRLVTRDTVEEGILALQERKRALADAALGDAAGATAITRDELLALLE